MTLVTALILQTYSWVAVVVLPINSVINPILYTISTEAFRSRLVPFVVDTIQRMRAAVTRLFGLGQDTAAIEVEMNPVAVVVGSGSPPPAS